MKNFILILALGFATALTACKQKNEVAVDPHAGHDHGEVKVLLTAYSENFELFAEADPFVVGSPSTILVHLTHLENFKPLQGSKVTLSLIVGTKGIRQTLENAERPGIYRFTLKPDAEGRGIITVDIETGDAKQRVEVPNITVFSDEHDAIHEAEEQAVTSPTAITFTKEQGWKVDFATAIATVEPFGQVIKSTAQVQPAQGDEVMVTAKTNGVVSFTNIGLQVGQALGAGQHLLTISGSGLGENSWNVKYAEAKNNYEKTKADFERLSALANDRIVTQTELIAAKTDYENAKVLYENLTDNFNAKGQRVLSPIGGFAKQLFVENGQYVEVGQPVIAISQNRTLQLTAEVQQKYLPILGSITSANFRILHNNNVYTLSQLNGKVLSYGRSLNPNNYLVPVIFQIDSKEEFVPGSFVEVYLKTLTNTAALTVPNNALLEEQGNFFVFVQLTPELFEKREVKKGVTDGLRVEILGGIDKNDRIVARGAMMVKLAQASAALDPHSGHVH
jgi:RND family efflux transporter MFP subunit